MAPSQTRISAAIVGKSRALFPRPQSAFVIGGVRLAQNPGALHPQPAWGGLRLRAHAGSDWSESARRAWRVEWAVSHRTLDPAGRRRGRGGDVRGDRAAGVSVSAQLAAQAILDMPRQQDFWTFLGLEV